MWGGEGGVTLCQRPSSSPEGGWVGETGGEGGLGGCEGGLGGCEGEGG